MTHYIPDYTDQLILMLISVGGDRCTYLSQVFDMSKASITQRAIKLQTVGLISIVDTSQQHSHRKYELTEKGKEEVLISQVLFQFRHLAQRKND